MTAISRKVISVNPDGTNTVQATIVSDSAPVTLPTTGAGIKGLLPSDVFAPLSAIVVVGQADDKTYLAGENGEFYPQ